MKRFVEGANRAQSTLLPESLDEWIDDSNPVRAMDVFVDELNLVNWASTALFRRRRVGRLTIHRLC